MTVIKTAQIKTNHLGCKNHSSCFSQVKEKNQTKFYSDIKYTYQNKLDESKAVLEKYLQCQMFREKSKENLIIRHILL